MTKQEIYQSIINKKSCLCIGLDTDINHTNFPKELLNEEYPLFEFNKAIIDATHDVCVGYKPNFAFYEAHGSIGYKSLEMTMDYLNTNYPNLFTIADAKRGDIGNTSKMYAKAIFEQMNFDSVTLSPYMGSNTVDEFLKYKNKWVIILALTSNKSHTDFQLTQNKTDKLLYQQVIEKANTWGNVENTMLVVGATNPKYFKNIRALAPDNFFLVPGIGAQGGSADEVMQNASNSNVGILISSSRSIILAAENGINFAEVARQKSVEFNNSIAQYLQ
ncbi:UNVERIFIED_CONTAM: hypothetical protein GTU68_002038 [Idotea baltica]|nr:hypothetical protein [Idotea baltica]